MRLVLLTALILLGCAAQVRTHPTMTFSAVRHDSPEAAVRAYFAGGDHCASRALRSAFHPAAHLWSVADGAVRSLAMAAWWQRTEQAKPCTPAADRQLRILDRDGPMALVEAVSQFADFRFHDLLLVADTPAGWLIVDKAFARLPLGAPPLAADSAEVRHVLQQKIDAAVTSSPELLTATHTDDCIYSRVHAGDVAFARESVSEWAARYAAARERGEDGRASTWQITAVHAFDTIAAAKLEIRSPTGRHIDHVLLVRAADGWRIAAATWGGGYAD